MDDRRIRAHIYERFVSTGRPPTAAATAANLGLTVEDVREGYHRLADQHEIALLPDTGEVWMAHPFSGVPTDYQVKAPDGRKWWANCAWDAVAIPGLVGNAKVHARLPDGSLFEAAVLDGVVSPDHVIHFRVPARNFWDDIGFT